MSILKSLVGGLAGSVALTIVHQLLQKSYENAPRMDLLGEEAIAKGYEKLGREVPEPEKLQQMALIGDIAMNAIVFSTAAGVMSSCTKGTILGIAAGVGGVKLPAKLGLNPVHSNKTPQTKWLTIAMYALGGYVAGKVIDKIN